MPRYAVTLEFDGHGFCGTAPQANGRTVFDVFRAALQHLDGDPRATRTSARLDAGVHARGFVVHLDHARDWVPQELARALNAQLPEDLVVWRVAQVPRDWDARFHARAKTYVYQVLVRGARQVLDSRCLQQRDLAHPERLQAGADALIGDHDLAAFACHRADGSDPERPVRRIDVADWMTTSIPGGRRYTFTIRGSGFLYKQIRGIVGALVAVAQGHATVDDFIVAIDAGWDHPRIGDIAPAQGLYLEAVHFEPEPVWEVL